MADENIDYAPDPVDPGVDPAAAEAQANEIPSEITSGFYDNTPVDELQAIDLQEIPPPGDPVSFDDIQTEQSTTLTPAELDALAEANGVNAGDGGNIPESALYRNETAAQNPYNQLGIDQGGFTGPLFNTNSTQAEITEALKDQARQQQTLAVQRKTVNNGDWRVKLKLAPNARYLYNAPDPGILQPLQVTDGIIFPYTPSITTAYKANYNQYDLTHSNYRGYFYQNSYVEPINLTCTFTAQGTSEANYLLAVITFFKSVTKMFYGQDAERGAPPPLVYLSGLGEYQFNEHPCLVSQFNLNLPADVNYIRAGSDNVAGGLNLINQRSRQSTALPSLFGGLNRLASAFLTKGALPNTPAPPSLGVNSPTYVPTKMEISITLLPVQSRSQVSKQFSVKNFANGNLIKGGFW